MSAVLGVGIPGIAGKLNSSPASAMLAELLGCLRAKDFAAALPGLELLPELSGLGLPPSALLSLPLPSLDGAKRLDGVSGGEDLSLPLPLPAMSCFRLSALARLPSVMRLGSSRGLQGHLPAAAAFCPLNWNIYYGISPSMQTPCTYCISASICIHASSPWCLSHALLERALQTPFRLA